MQLVSVAVKAKTYYSFRVVFFFISSDQSTTTITTFRLILLAVAILSILSWLRLAVSLLCFSFHWNICCSRTLQLFWIKKADWLWDPKKFQNQLKMLFSGCWQDGSGKLCNASRSCLFHRRIQTVREIIHSTLFVRLDLKMACALKSIAVWQECLKSWKRHTGHTADWWRFATYWYDPEILKSHFPFCYIDYFSRHL